MFMKRNRNIGRRVVYPHILEGARKGLQAMSLRVKTNSIRSLMLQSTQTFKAPFPSKLCQYFGPGGSNSNVQISNALERWGWGMLKFWVNQRITANSKWSSEKSQALNKINILFWNRYRETVTVIWQVAWTSNFLPKQFQNKTWCTTTIVILQ